MPVESGGCAGVALLAQAHAGSGRLGGRLIPRVHRLAQNKNEFAPILSGD